jgi:CheY-like chemotaxis protein
MTILVVDDARDYAELISHGLEKQGHRVLVANDGQEGLNMARRYLPDLIVLDLMMPGLDGYSVCEILRAQPSTHAVPIIILTAMSGEIARLNSLASGASLHLEKTTPLRLLLRQLNEFSQVRIEVVGIS